MRGVTQSLTAIIAAHNPDATRLARTLAGLRAQTLPEAEFETLLIDNASDLPLETELLRAWAPTNLRILREPSLGLTAARAAGFAASAGSLLILVDDDNVLEPGYFAAVKRLFTENPRVGVLGGKSLPEFQARPPAWVREFEGLLACRDFGGERRISDVQGGAAVVPFAPIGAGMAIRREASQAWLARADRDALTDRRGKELTSGGDNDIVFTAMEEGWDIGYFPELSLTHLIPPQRTTREYLAKLNRGIAKSWIRVLTRHGICPWRPIAHWTVPIRKVKAWFICRAWSGDAAHVRWRGACGHFEGRAV